MSGWVCLHRALIDWEWYDDTNTVRLFVHLLLKANHKPKVWRGEHIPAGSFITGRKALSEETGLSERNIRTCFDKLKSTGEVTIKATNKYSLVTITNWDIYQQKGNEATSKKTNKAPNERPSTDHQPTTTNNDNNDNKKDIDVLFDSFWASGIRKAAKKQAKIVFTKLLESKQQKHEFTAYLIRDIQWRLANCQKGFEELHPTTYLRNERWTDERRGQQQIKPNGSKLSLAGKSEEQTKILQARIAAGDFDQRPLGSDDAAISTQVGFGGRGQDGSSPAVDGEFYTLVPENGRVDG